MWDLGPIQHAAMPAQDGDLTTICPRRLHDWPIPTPAGDVLERDGARVAWLRQREFDRHRVHRSPPSTAHQSGQRADPAHRADAAADRLGESWLTPHPAGTTDRPMEEAALRRRVAWCRRGGDRARSRATGGCLRDRAVLGTQHRTVTGKRWSASPSNWHDLQVSNGAQQLARSAGQPEQRVRQRGDRRQRRLAHPGGRLVAGHRVRFDQEFAPASAGSRENSSA